LLGMPYCMRVKPLILILLVLVTFGVVQAQETAAPKPIEPPSDGRYHSIHVPILMYHFVSDLPSESNASRRDLTVTPAIFHTHLAYLSAQGYHTISLAQLDNALMTGASLPAKPIVLTFDDGYEDAYTNVLPALRAYGFTATFFIITGMADANDPAYLSWAQIRAMSALGMDMEAHTVSHVDLRGRSREDQVKQIAGSIESLQVHTGKAVHFFAYPGGAFDAETLAILKANSIWLAVTTRDSAWETSSAPLELPRLRIHHDMGAAGLAELLKAN